MRTELRSTLQQGQDIPPVLHIGSRSHLLSERKLSTQGAQASVDRFAEDQRKLDAQEARRIEQLLEKQSRGMSPERRRFLEARAVALVEQRDSGIVGALLEQFSAVPAFAHIAHSAQFVSEQCASAQEHLAARRIEQARETLGAVLSHSAVLQEGHSVTSAYFFGAEEFGKLAVLSKQLAVPRLQERAMAEVIELLSYTQAQLQNPAHVVGFFLEQFFSEQEQPEVKLQVRRLAEALEPVQEYHRITQVLDGIQCTPFVTDRERKFVRARAFQELLKHKHCPAAWAADLAAGKQIFETLSVRDVISSLLLPDEPIKQTPVSTRLKRLNAVLAALLAAGVLMQGAAHWRTVSEQVVEVVQATAEIAGELGQDVFEYLSNPQAVDEGELQELLAEYAQRARSSRDEAEREADEVAEQPMQVTQERAQEQVVSQLLEPLSTQEVSWAPDSASSTEVSLGSTVTPEMYRLQRSKVVWEILRQPPGEIYFPQKLLAVFSPQDGSFETSLELTNQLEVLPLETGAVVDFELSAKRTFLDVRTEVPAPIGYLLEQVSVSIVGTDGVERGVPVRAMRTADGTNVVELLSGEPLRAGESQQIILTVGMRQDAAALYDSSLVWYDGDRTLSDFSVLPTEVQELIETLNTQDLPDIQKVEQLRNWYLRNFTYSMDPEVRAYLERGNPDVNTLLRRLYGTGSVAADPHYEPDSPLSRKGVCSTVNTNFASAARYLNLEGQVILATGFLALPAANENVENLLTQGSLHAFTLYLSPEGAATVVDATPTRVDPLTQQQFNALNTGETITPEAAQVAEVEQLSVRNLDELLTAPPPPSFERILAQHLTPSDKPGNWRITGDYVFPPADSGTVPLMLQMEGGRWKLPASLTPLDVPYTLPQIDYIEGSRLLYETAGKQLQTRALWLPTTEIWSIDPSTIRVVAYKPEHPEQKQPVAVQQLVRTTLSHHSPLLVLDVPEEMLRTHVFDIQYEVSHRVQNKEYRIPESAAKELFQPIVDREVFEIELQQLLALLDQNPTYRDVYNLGTIPGLEFYDVNQELFDVRIETESEKLKFLVLYLRGNYQVTLSDEWQQLYLEGNPTNREYFERIVRHRRLGTQSSVDLVAAAMSTLRVKQGGPTLPLMIRNQSFPEGMVSALSGRAEQNTFPTANQVSTFEEGLTIPQLDVLSYIDESEPGFTLLQPAWNARFSFTDLLQAIDLNAVERIQDPAYVSPPYDTQSKHTAVSLFQELGNLYREVHGSPNYTIQRDRSNSSYYEHFQWFESQRLPASELRAALTKDFFELDFYRWLYRRGALGIMAELGAAAAAGFLLGDWVRRRTRWMRAFDQEVVGTLLDELRPQLRAGHENEIFRELEAYWQQVGSRYTPRNIFSPLALIDAARMARFARSRERHTLFYELRHDDFSPLSPEHTSEYIYKLRQRVHYPGSDAVLAGRALHELFATPFAHEVGRQAIRVSFEPEVVGLLRARNLDIPSPLTELLGSLERNTHDRTFGLSPEVLEDHTLCRERKEKLTSMTTTFLEVRARKLNPDRVISQDDFRFLTELAAGIVDGVLVPYVERIHAETAVLRKRK